MDANEWTLPGTRSVLAARTWPNPHARWLAILVHGYGEHIGRYQHVADAYRDDPLVWHGPFKRATLEAIDRSLQTANEAGVLEDLPVLWVHGDEDELVPMADTRTGIDRIRGSAFEERIYPGARHELFNETNRAEVLADVVAFLNRAVDQRAPSR